MDGNSASHSPAPAPASPAQGPIQAKLGSFEWFDPTLKDWDSNISQFLFYVDVNRITDPLKQCSTFFNVCRWVTYTVARAILVPRDLAALDFTEIIAKLKNHYSPRLSLIALQHAFHMWSQALGEFVTGFITTLRNTAWDYKFGELEDMLRNCLVCSLWDEWLLA